ncbi:MAG: crossover junction endodeoxyribonuclease RuvC [bacterium]
MRVLGVDPGFANTGWGVITQHDAGIVLEECGCIQTKANDLTGVRLSEIYSRMREVLNRHKPDVLAVEELYFTKRALSIFLLGQARGVVLLLAQQSGMQVFEYNPRTIKMSLTGFGGAEKNQMQQMVKVLLRLNDIPKPDDVADALAVALCHVNSSKVRNRIGSIK